MKILITGGAGFVGSTLAGMLMESHQVVVLDDLSTGKYENIADLLPQVKFYLQDVRAKGVEQIFALEKPEIVVHLAAQTSVLASLDDPALDEDINLKGILNLLNSCVAHKTKKVIFTSSGGTIYGNTDQLPIPESCISNVVSPYALTKYTSEMYLKIYKEQYGVEYTILRPGNIYGPRQVARGETGVIPIFLEKCMRNETAVLFVHPQMEKGTSRDYVYVDDACEAIKRCLTCGDGEIFNIGAGEETYTLDIFHKIKQMTAASSDITTRSALPGDVKRVFLDSSKAKELLGWEPKMDFDTGLELTYQWIKSEQAKK